MFEHEPVLRVLLYGAACGVLLYSLYRAVMCFSAKRQHDAVRAMQKYFYEQVYPRGELAPHLRELTPQPGRLGAKKPPRTEDGCPRQWVERGAAELNSAYFLRTGQQVSFLAAVGRERNWYGLEGWVRDIVASRGSLDCLAGTGEKPSDERKGTGALGDDGG